MPTHPSQAELARIRRTDPALAGLVEDVLESLTAESDLGTISLYELQEFLWYELPFKWMTPLASDQREESRRLTDALGSMFAAADLDARADLCRSSVTRGVHDAWARSSDDGWRAYRAAMDRSGLVPPDLDDFRWSDVMGMAEARGYGMVTDALSAAVLSGTLRVGAKGWRTEQKRLTTAVLDGSSPESGRSVRGSVLHERLEDWVSLRPRSDWLRARRARVADALFAPGAPPDGFDGCLEPLSWFLQEVGEGLALTQRFNLNRAFVIAAAEARGWRPEFRGMPRREEEVPQLAAIHELAVMTGAVRRQRRVLQLTRAGRRMLVHPEQAWSAVRQALAAREGADRFALEVLALTLVQGAGPREEGSMRGRLAEVLNEEGYRSHPSGEPVTGYAASWLLAPARKYLEAVGLLSEQWKGNALELSPTPQGEAMVRDVLWLLATGPVRR